MEEQGKCLSRCTEPIGTTLFVQLTHCCCILGGWHQHQRLLSARLFDVALGKGGGETQPLQEKELQKGVWLVSVVAGVGAAAADPGRLLPALQGDQIVQSDASAHCHRLQDGIGTAALRGARVSAGQLHAIDISAQYDPTIWLVMLASCLQG